MISKRTRRGRTSVETLSQGSFVASKGINETASVLSPDTVGYMKNFDIAKDGTLVLRNALEVGFTIPNFGNKPPILVIPVTHSIKLAFYAFSETSGTASVYIAAFDSETSTQPPIKLKWVNWETGVDEIRTLEEYPLDNESYVCVRVPFLQNTDFHYVNTVTNVILYNAVIDYTSTVFIDPATQKNLLVNTGLYKSGSNTVSTITRALQLLYKNGELTVIVVTPEIPELVFNDTGIPADFNYALDNPYTLTDRYNQTLAQVKGMLLYLPIAQADPYKASQTWGSGQEISSELYGTDLALKPVADSASLASGIAQAYTNYSDFAQNVERWEPVGVPNMFGVSVAFKYSIGAPAANIRKYALRAGLCSFKFDPYIIEYVLDVPRDSVLSFDATSYKYRWNPATFNELYYTKSSNWKASENTVEWSDMGSVQEFFAYVETRFPRALSDAFDKAYFQEYVTNTLGDNITVTSPKGSFDILGINTIGDSHYANTTDVFTAVLGQMLGMQYPDKSTTYTESHLHNGETSVWNCVRHNVSYVYNDGNYTYVARATEDIRTSPDSGSVFREVSHIAIFKMQRVYSLDITFSKLLLQGYPEIPEQRTRFASNAVQTGGNLWLP